jgi:hypothetical protein
VHDIRRSVATRMAGLGVLPHIIEAVLNHVSGHKSGVAGIYNRAFIPTGDAGSAGAVGRPRTHDRRRWGAKDRAVG